MYLGTGQSPPFAGLHDVRLLARRAAIGAMLTPEQLLETAGTLACTGHMYRFRMRLGPSFQRLDRSARARRGSGPRRQID